MAYDPHVHGCFQAGGRLTALNADPNIETLIERAKGYETSTKKSDLPKVGLRSIGKRRRR